MGNSRSHVVLNAAECTVLEEVPYSVHKRWLHTDRSLPVDRLSSPENANNLQIYETAQFYAKETPQDVTPEIKQYLQVLEDVTKKPDEIQHHHPIENISPNSPRDYSSDKDDLPKIKNANNGDNQIRPERCIGEMCTPAPAPAPAPARVYVDYFEQFPTQSYTTETAVEKTDIKITNQPNPNQQESSVQEKCSMFTVYHAPLPMTDEAQEKYKSDISIENSTPHSIIHISQSQPKEIRNPIKRVIQYMAMPWKSSGLAPINDNPNQRQTTEQQLYENLYRFVLGGVSGIIGASSVFPIDVVKTRMQNQRRLPDGTLRYNGSLDCFKQIFRNEGLLGFYRGLPPLLFGVTPEKATKLAVNDFMRDQFTSGSGEISLLGEIISGGCGGFAQIIFTNPLELIKIRMQLAGETGQQHKVFEVIRDIGVRNLYQGSRATWMRDIAFTAMYFPLYSFLKKELADSEGINSPSSLFLSALCAGVPTATLVTPIDVIKTRLQSKPLPGQTVYTGVVNAAKIIYRYEGFGAFWKGTLARVMRSAPQFAVTLLMYEMLQRFFNIDFGGPNDSDNVQTKKVANRQTRIRPIELVHHVDHIGGLCLLRLTPK